MGLQRVGHDWATDLIWCMLSRVQLFVTPQIVTCQAPLPMEFPRQECWSGLSFSPPGDLPNPGIESTFPASPALAGGLFTTLPRKCSWEQKKLPRKTYSFLPRDQLGSICNCHSTRLLMTLQCEWLVQRTSPKIYGGQHTQWPGASFSPLGWLCNQVLPMEAFTVKTLLRGPAKEYHKIFCNSVSPRNANSLGFSPRVSYWMLNLSSEDNTCSLYLLLLFYFQVLFIYY